MELAASDDASPIPARQFRRRKSLGELVQGIKIKYSREKMTKDSDADSRNQSRSEAYTSLEPISGSQSMLLQNPWQQRCSLPIPVPERYASIAYDSLPVSPVSSTPPRLDVLHDLASDNVQKASTFRDGLEKAVNDINTKYGDSTKAFISSSSPTNSIALRDKNTFRSRFVVPIYGEEPIPNARPVIGELWTALKSQDEPLQSSKPHADISTDNSNTASPFHDSLKLMMYLPPRVSLVAMNHNSHSDETVSGNAKEKTDIISQDKTDVAGTEPGSPFESPNEDSLYSQDSGSTSALSQGTSSEQNSSVANYIATSKADLEATPRATGDGRGRNSSAPSVAALMSLKNKTKCR
ncbi:hypothetical protein LMH87_009748 [Akanthomyces muscarius]|uniref:Uncharacterized protein n=1 Tax=Akanthomyces muscarius TaxID=2231603 RepID=A0A9W8UMH7_AKAMU|nr:hypothetical protein LMH87_009748 [Akanthomyces muscarius]KAJ4153252.1 hypothetical protein LMH87_009748 [Akanthomyces muscarius]